MKIVKTATVAGYEVGIISYYLGGFAVYVDDGLNSEIVKHCVKEEAANAEFDRLTATD